MKLTCWIDVKKLNKFEPLFFSISFIFFDCAVVLCGCVDFSLVAMLGLLIAVASLVAENRL